MDYMTAREAAEQWGLAERTVQKRMDGLMERNPMCTVQDVIDELMQIMRTDAIPGRGRLRTPPLLCPACCP